MTKDGRAVTLNAKADRRRNMRTDSETVYVLSVARELSRMDARSSVDGTASIWFQDYLQVPKTQTCSETSKIGYCKFTMSADKLSVPAGLYVMENIQLTVKDLTEDSDGEAKGSTRTTVKMNAENGAFTFECVKYNSSSTDEMKPARESAFSPHEIALIASDEMWVIEGTAKKKK